MTTFSRHTALLLLLALIGAWTLTGCDSGANGPEPVTFTADLNALNSSGVSGRATITTDGSNLSVDVDAQGVEADKVHAQHIHGFADKSSSCPTAAADTSGDGMISVGEGAPSYGGILVPLDGSLDNAEGLGDLETFPTGEGGSYAYSMSIGADELDVNGDGKSFDNLNLGQHAIVVHGRTVSGSYKATRPVACGTLVRQ